MSIDIVAVPLRGRMEERHCHGEALSEDNDGRNEWCCSQTAIHLRKKTSPQNTRHIALVNDKSAIGIALERHS